jgi:hypothetical protein
MPDQSPVIRIYQANQAARANSPGGFSFLTRGFSWMITAERLRNLLSYDRKTGLFRWLVRTSNRISVGDVAGGKHVGGYRKISIDGVSYLAHVLAVLTVTGRFPARPVRHRNGNRADDRWRNLRVA